MYYDRQGEPLAPDLWARLMQSAPYKRVAYTEICEGINVSTVWLGLDHNWGEGPPLIFESMVFVALDERRRIFGREIDEDGTEMYRWSTEFEAIEGHLRIVRELAGAIRLERLPATLLGRSSS